MEPIVLAYFGVGLSIVISGLISAWGVTVTGNASVGAMKKNPDAFGNYMIMTALPGTQGLYGFLGYFLLSGYLTPEITMYQAKAIFFCGLALAIVNFYACYRQAQIATNSIKTIAEGHDIFGQALILAVFPELYCIVALASVFLIGGTL